MNSSSALRILITNTALAGRSGTEIFVAQLADALRSRGHEVVLYSPLVGELGVELRRSGHAVFDRIANIEPPPDVIHAHHVGPTLTALTAFPNTPAIFVMHSVDAEFDAPPLHPQIVSYHAVSSFIRAQRASTALPASAIGLLYNAVDLACFPLKSKLRARPERALLVAKSGAGRKLIRETCLRLGLSFDEIGAASGRVTSDLAGAFHDTDIVLASGRSALEALASGCAVVLTEGTGFGGLVQPKELETLLDLNLGVRAMADRLTESTLEAAITDYDNTAALAVARRVREVRSLETQVDKVLTLYVEAMLHERQTATRDRQLAKLIEAYIPSHGDLPWRELARSTADGSLRVKLDVLSRANRFALADEYDLPLKRLTYGLHRFQIGESECKWLLTGWWEPEEWGVWSKAIATLLAPIALGINQITLRYRLGPGVSPDDPPSLRIDSDNREICLADSPAEPDGIRELTFNVRVAGLNSESLSLTFKAPRAKSPVEVGVSVDQRRLGVGLISLIAHPRS